MLEQKPTQIGILVDKSNARKDNQTFSQPYPLDSFVYKSNLDKGYGFQSQSENSKNYNHRPTSLWMSITSIFKSTVVRLKFPNHKFYTNLKNK